MLIIRYGGSPSLAFGLYDIRLESIPLSFGSCKQDPEIAISICGIPALNRDGKTIAIPRRDLPGMSLFDIRNMGSVQVSPLRPSGIKQFIFLTFS